MRILDIFLGKPFLKHLSIALLLIFFLLWATLKFIGCYTKHGDEIIIPNLVGVNINEIDQYNANGDFEFMVIDSVYDDDYEKGAIVLQDPPARSMVKRGRKIYLTIMSSQPKMVVMPNLVDLSLRQGLVQLKAAGLNVGILEYTDHFAKNAVLDQKLDGAFVRPGTMLQKGTAIHLVMGKGLDPEKISVPFLIGKTEQEASDLLNSISLNVGEITYFDQKDKLHSRVYMQSPAAKSDTLLGPGSFVDLWFKSDYDFDFEKLINSLQADTLPANDMEDDSLLLENDEE